MAALSHHDKITATNACGCEPHPNRIAPNPVMSIHENHTSISIPASPTMPNRRWPNKAFFPCHLEDIQVGRRTHVFVPSGMAILAVNLVLQESLFVRSGHPVTILAQSGFTGEPVCRTSSANLRPSGNGNFGSQSTPGRRLLQSVLWFYRRAIFA